MLRERKKEYELLDRVHKISLQLDPGGVTINPRA